MTLLLNFLFFPATLAFILFGLLLFFWAYFFPNRSPLWFYFTYIPLLYYVLFYAPLPTF